MNEIDLHDINTQLDQIKTIAELLYQIGDNKKLSSEACHGMGQIIQEACVAIDSVLNDLLYSGDMN